MITWVDYNYVPLNIHTYVRKYVCMYVAVLTLHTTACVCRHFHNEFKSRACYTKKSLLLVLHLQPHTSAVQGAFGYSALVQPETLTRSMPLWRSCVVLEPVSWQWSQLSTLQSGGGNIRMWDMSALYSRAVCCFSTFLYVVVVTHATPRDVLHKLRKVRTSGTMQRASFPST